MTLGAMDEGLPGLQICEQLIEFGDFWDGSVENRKQAIIERSAEQGRFAEFRGEIDVVIIRRIDFRGQQATADGQGFGDLIDGRLPAQKPIEMPDSQGVEMKR